ncbi:MAG TPA: hypothetical protein VN631_13140 [Negativicutes bacterium]|nr:hypothetical protein [Negativicutes bacterium]
MADYAWKNIEDVKAGEYVIGIENEPLLVRASVGLRLGPWQHMMEFPDKSLVFSSEHAFWIKGKDEKQWWGSNDIHHWLREERELGDYWLREEEELTSKLPDEMHVNFGILEPMPIILTGHEFYAHIDGWKQHDPITIRDRMYSDDYILRHLITEKSHTYIANGYVVSGNISDTNGEYDHTKTDWKGLVRKHG